MQHMAHRTSNLTTSSNHPHRQPRGNRMPDSHGPSDEDHSHEHHDHNDHLHDSHDHHHNHNHDHDHDHDLEPALATHLYQAIDFAKVATLNESEPNAGRSILSKTWAQRLTPTPYLSSDSSDPQLLFIIPFAGAVALHTVLVRSSAAASAPRTLHLHANAPPGLDFDGAAARSPTQTLQLARTSEVQEVAVARARFNNVYSLALLVDDSWGAEETEMWYLGFRGLDRRLSREPVEVLYEKAANPRDHAPIVGVGGLQTGMRRGM